VTVFVYSALGKRLVANIATMKKAAKRTPRVGPDDILLEYDFSKGRRNPYAARMAAGSHIIVLEPDVAAVFPDAAAVNGALRALAGIIRERRPRTSSSRRKSKRGSASQAHAADKRVRAGIRIGQEVPVRAMERSDCAGAKLTACS
jgi:hypothetical protein